MNSLDDVHEYSMEVAVWNISLRTTGQKNDFQEETFDFHSAATESRFESKIPKMDRLGPVLLVHTDFHG